MTAPSSVWSSQGPPAETPAGASPGRKDTTGSSGDMPGGPGSARSSASTGAPMAARMTANVSAGTSIHRPAMSWYPAEMPQSCMALLLPHRVVG
jgi:hypothetical protein